MGRKPNLEKYRKIIIMKNNRCKQNEIKYTLQCSTETIGKALKYSKEHPNFMPQYTGLNIVRKNEQQRIEYNTSLQLLKSSLDLLQEIYASNEIPDFIELYNHINKMDYFLQGKIIKYKIN